MFRVSKHKCGNPWLMCTVCRGRMHTNDCATRTSGKLNPAKDCCAKRHIKLHSEGHEFGLDDSSVPMLEGYEKK